MANLEKQCFCRNVGGGVEGKSLTGPCVCIAHRVGWESSSGKEGSPMGPPRVTEVCTDPFSKACITSLCPVICKPAEKGI